MKTTNQISTNKLKNLFFNPINNCKKPKCLLFENDSVLATGNYYFNTKVYGRL